MTTHDLITRWDAFLYKMNQRFHDSLLQAEEACLQQLEDSDYDYNTTYRSWQAMKAQIFQLFEKIDQTWDTTVQPQMQEVGDFWMDEMKKSTTLTDKLHRHLQRFEVVFEGKLSQKFYDHAIALANKKLTCTQCHAPITIVKDLFRAHYISCSFCNAVNTFEPETKYAQIGWSIIDNIAALQSLPSYDAMQKALNELHQHRPPQPELLWNNYKTAYYNYYQTYFKERIKLKSDAEDRYQQDMARKQKEFEDYEKIHRKS